MITRARETRVRFESGTAKGHLRRSHDLPTVAGRKG